jgi:amino acid permease
MESYWDMIGFSFFMFEGIGSVMPIMNASNSEAKARFPCLIGFALATLCTIYILFSELCYYNFGDGLNEPIVMQ